MQETKAYATGWHILQKLAVKKDLSFTSTSKTNQSLPLESDKIGEPTRNKISSFVFLFSCGSKTLHYELRNGSTSSDLAPKIAN